MPGEKKSAGKKSRALTPKQKKAVEYVQKAVMGDITIEEALKKAGYSDITAKQQKVVLDQLRKNSEMQKAMKKAGIDENLIVSKLRTGLDTPAKDTMFKFLKLAAELMDAFPANKNINTDVGVEHLLDDAENGADYADWDSEEKGK